MLKTFSKVSVVLISLLNLQRAIACPGAGSISLNADLGKGPVEIGYVDTYEGKVKVNPGFTIDSVAAQKLALGGYPFENICSNAAAAPGITVCGELIDADGALTIQKQFKERYGKLYVLVNQDKASSGRILFEATNVNLIEDQPHAKSLGCGGSVVGVVEK